MTKQELLKKIEETKCRSAWQRGVKEYALEMAENFDNMPENTAELKSMCLNGAGDFVVLSYGGGYLVYDEDICERLCNNTEKKRTNYGEKQPNSRESWLDVQSRALYQAYRLIRRCYEF